MPIKANDPENDGSSMHHGHRGLPFRGIPLLRGNQTQRFTTANGNTTPVAGVIVTWNHNHLPAKSVTLIDNSRRMVRFEIHFLQTPLHGLPTPSTPGHARTRI